MGKFVFIFGDVLCNVHHVVTCIDSRSTTAAATERDLMFCSAEQRAKNEFAMQKLSFSEVKMFGLTRFTLKID